jgi:hypothetical protein
VWHYLQAVFMAAVQSIVVAIVVTMVCVSIYKYVNVSIDEVVAMPPDDSDVFILIYSPEPAYQ